MNKQEAKMMFDAATENAKRESMLNLVQNEGGEGYEHNAAGNKLAQVLSELKKSGFAVRKNGEIVDASDMAKVRETILPLCKGCKTPAQVDAAIKSTGWTYADYSDCRNFLGIK